MHYLLHVRLEGFYVRELQAQFAGRPLVVHRDKRVLDACPLARAARVEVGMALSEAKAILEGGAFVRWEEEPYRAAQARWLDICADMTDVVEPIEAHTALLDLSDHPDPTAVADRLVARLRDELGYDLLVGNGNCRWVAELASSLNVGLAPILQPARFVRDLSTHRLAPVDPADRERLVFLGYRHAGEVAQVPLEVLRAQFGDAAFEIFRAARGGGDPVVVPSWPQGCLSSRLSFDGPPQDVEALLSGFEEVARQLGEGLVSRDLQGRRLEVFLEHEEAAATVLSRTFSKPAHSLETVMAGLRLMLAEPPETPVVGVRVRMPDLEPAKRVQRSLEGRRDERERSAAAAFQHIRRVFGDTAILVAGQMPEPRRRRLLRMWRDATGWA